MAGYRQFHTKFWKDEWTIDLDPLEKYLFIYLFSNELSSISGIYKIPFKVITNETGLEPQFIRDAFTKFKEHKKVLYHDNTIWVVNMEKYHANASDKTQIKVAKDVALIPNNLVKQAYVCFKETGIVCMDTLSIGDAYQSLKTKAKDKSKAKDKTESENKSEAEEGTENPPLSPASPPASPPAFKPADPADRVWRLIKPSSYNIPPTLRESVIPIIDAVLHRHKMDESKAAEEGKTYFDAWCKRRGKNGKYYSHNGTGWIDWWAQGEIPPTNGAGDEPHYSELHE